MATALSSLINQPGEDFISQQQGEQMPYGIEAGLVELMTKALEETKAIVPAWAAKWSRVYHYERGNQHLEYDIDSGVYLGYNTFFARYGNEEEADEGEDYTINIFRAHSRTIQSVLTSHPLNVIFEPVDVDKESIEAAERAERPLNWIEDVNRLEERKSESARHLTLGGTHAIYWEIGEDARLGWVEEPIFEQQMVQVGTHHFACPDCGNQISPGDFQGICPECGSALADENGPLDGVERLPESVPQQVQTGATERPRRYPKMRVIPVYELRLPYYDERDDEHAYIIWEKDIPAYKLRAQGIPVSGKRFGQWTAPERVSAHSLKATPGGSGLEQATQVMGTSAAEGDMLRRGWFRPQAYWLIKTNRDTRRWLLENFPRGCKITTVGDTQRFISIEEEIIEDRLTIFHALKGEGAYSDGLMDDHLQISDILNDITNLKEQYIQRAAAPFIIADILGLDKDDLRRTAGREGMIMAARARGDRTLGQSIYQHIPAPLSSTVVQTEAGLIDMGKYAVSVNDALIGKIENANQTAAGYSMQVEQALGVYRSIITRWKQKWAESLQQGLWLLESTTPEEVVIPVRDSSGKWAASTFSGQGLRDRVRVRPETDTGAPVWRFEKVAKFENLLHMGLISVDQIMRDPLAMQRIEELYSMKDFVSFPGRQHRERQRVEINELLESVPQPFPQQDPQTGETIESTRASVPTDDLTDDHMWHWLECQSWLNSATAQELKRSNPEKYQNVRLHGEEHYTKLKQTQEQQQKSQGGRPPATSIAFKDLPITGQVQMAQQAGIELTPQDTVEDKQLRAQVDVSKVAQQAQINRAVTQPPQGQSPQQGQMPEGVA